MSKKTITAYKAFNQNWQCNGYQFEVGQEYEHKGDIQICSKGFHSCENPMDVLSYYNLCESKFALVEVSGETQTHDDDSKICSSKIKIKAELSLKDFVKVSLDWHFDGWFTKAIKVKNSKKASDKYGAQLAASGDGAQLAASGNWAKLAASGYGAQLEQTEKPGVICCVERKSKVKGTNGSLIALVHYDKDNETPLNFVTGKIGQEGLKENVWYELDSKGNFKEAA